MEDSVLRFSDIHDHITSHSSKLYLEDTLAYVTSCTCRQDSRHYMLEATTLSSQSG